MSTTHRHGDASPRRGVAGAAAATGTNGSPSHHSAAHAAHSLGGAAPPMSPGLRDLLVATGRRPASTPSSSVHVKARADVTPPSAVSNGRSTASGSVSSPDSPPPPAQVAEAGSGASRTPPWNSPLRRIKTHASGSEGGEGGDESKRSGAYASAYVGDNAADGAGFVVAAKQDAFAMRRHATRGIVAGWTAEPDVKPTPGDEQPGAGTGRVSLAVQMEASGDSSAASLAAHAIPRAAASAGAGSAGAAGGTATTIATATGASPPSTRLQALVERSRAWHLAGKRRAAELLHVDEPTLEKLWRWTRELVSFALSIPVETYHGMWAFMVWVTARVGVAVSLSMRHARRGTLLSMKRMLALLTLLVAFLVGPFRRRRH